MTPNPIMAEIDQAIKSLAKGNGDPIKIAAALTTGIKFLADVIKSLKEQNAELIEDTEGLIERIEELEVDQGIILSFLQGQGIDISYIVKKNKSDTTDNNS
jgi:hypothetical protein